MAVDGAISDHTVSGNSLKRVARFNSDGSVDVSFNPGAGVANGVISSALQPNGKILIVGNFVVVDGATCRYIACLNVNGSLDSGFNPGGYGAYATVSSINLQADGKIIIGGLFQQYNGSTRSHVARLKLDETTAVEPIASQAAFSIYPNPATKGGVVCYSGIEGEGTLQIFNPHGQKVAEHLLTKSKNTFPVSVLTTGLYRVRLISSNQKIQVATLLVNP